MLELKKGEDILAYTGGVATVDQAKTVIEHKLDAKNLEKLAPIKNEDALVKIANAIALCEPDDVFIDTGSEADTQWVREYSLRKGEEKKLAKEGHSIHFDLPQELIAQHPLERRSDSRLLQLPRGGGAVADRMFRELPGLLEAGDLLVFNDTRVIPARLFGHKQSGGRVEVLVELETGGGDRVVRHT